MKRWWWLMVMAMVLLPCVAGAQTVFRPANQITFAWDAATKLVDGTPIPAGSTVQYQVYIRTDPNGTPTAAGNPITATSAVVTFSAEGKYNAGVKAMRLVSGAVVSESAISWSNDPAAAQGGTPFGVIYYGPPAAPTNLR